MIERGRKLVLLDIGLIMGVSIVTITFYVASIGSSRLFPQVVRLLLTALLCLLLYRGYRLARYAAIAMISLAFGFSVVLVPKVLNGERPLSAVATVLTAAIYFFVARNLAWSKSVREFLDQQREKRSRRGALGL